MRKTRPKYALSVLDCPICRLDCSVYPNMFYNIKNHFVDVNKMINFALSIGG